MAIQSKPCYLCGHLMYENGDGWCAGEPGSPAGFYSAHWACVHENDNGEWIVRVTFNGQALPDQYRRYTTKRRADQVAEQLAGWNRNTGYAFDVIHASKEAVSHA